MKLINFYEVMDRKGDVVWGGADAYEAVVWFRRELGGAIFASVWNEEDDENPTLVTDKVEITRIILATIVNSSKEMV